MKWRVYSEEIDMQDKKLTDLVYDLEELDGHTYQELLAFCFYHLDPKEIAMYLSSFMFWKR